MRVALLYAEVGVVDLERRDYVENGLGIKKKQCQHRIDHRNSFTFLDRYPTVVRQFILIL